MKVVFIFECVVRMGGLERIFVDKMNYFADIFKWDVTLITYEQGTHPCAYPLSDKVRHIDLNCRFFTLYKYSPLVRMFKWVSLLRKFKKKLNAVINDLNPDIINCTTYDADLLKAINSCRTNCIKIAESHIYSNYRIDKKCDYDTRLKERIDHYRIIRQTKKMDLVVCLTKRDTDCWKNIKRTAIIPNIITSYPENVTYNIESKHAIAAGRLVSQKGFNILIDIWKIVHERNKEWILDIYGTGDEKDMLLRKINNYGLGKHIIIHDPVSNIYEKYQESGLFVLSSKFEGYGLVLVEAMANGLPCVSFDCPCGPSDIMGEDNEFLVPQYDIEMFADKICYLIDNPEKRKEESNRNRLLSARYKGENIMPMWKELYEKEMQRSNS